MLDRPDPALRSPARPALVIAFLVAGGPLAVGGPPLGAQEPGDPAARVDALTAEIEPQVVSWRCDIHANPELGFGETRTARLAAHHLRSPPEDPSLAHPDHSPLFYADERALELGVRTMASLAVDYLVGGER